MKTKVALVLSLGALLLAGCNGTSSSTTTIKFEFLKAGFGVEPYQNIATAYEKEHPGVKVKLVPNSNIESEFAAKITTGTNLSDLVIYHSYNSSAKILNWAKKGYLYNFKSALEDEIQTGVTFGSMLDENAKKAGEYKDGFYTIPEYYSINGFVYNADLFNEMKLTVPTTTAELKAVCDKIVSTKYKGNDVKPFVYSGGANGADGYLYYAIDGWMTSYEGVSNLDTFYKFESAEVYNPNVSQGKVQGMTKLKDFLYNDTYLMPKSAEKSAFEAQGDILTSSAAMMVNGSWFENEMKKYYTETTPNLKMFAIPEISDVSGNVLHANGYTTNAKKQQVINATANASFVIPEKANNKAGALDLLKFICRKDIAEQFTLDTNAVRPLNYDYSSSNSKYATMSDFGKSVLDLVNNSCVYVPLSKADLYIKQKASLYPQGGYWFKRMKENPTKYTPEFCVQSDYDYAVANWSDWEKAN